MSWVVFPAIRYLDQPRAGRAWASYDMSHGDDRSLSIGCVESVDDLLLRAGAGGVVDLWHVRGKLRVINSSYPSWKSCVPGAAPAADQGTAGIASAGRLVASPISREPLAVLNWQNTSSFVREPSNLHFL